MIDNKTQKDKNAAPVRGRPRNEERHDEILQAAGTLFLEQGYHGTRMDDIAAVLGISKLTLYSRFASKDELFTAVISNKCEQYIPEMLFDDFDNKAPEDALYGIAWGLMQLLVSGDACNMERMMIAQAPKREELANMFYEAGPMRVKRMIAERLAKLNARGVLKIDDTMQATHIFTSLIKGSDVYARHSMEITPRPTEKELQDHCKTAVSVFMSAYKSR